MRSLVYRAINFPLSLDGRRIIARYWPDLQRHATASFNQFVIHQIYHSRWIRNRRGDEFSGYNFIVLSANHGNPWAIFLFTTQRNVALLLYCFIYTHTTKKPYKSSGRTREFGDSFQDGVNPILRRDRKPSSSIDLPQRVVRSSRVSRPGAD